MDRHLQLRVLQTRSQGTYANLISRPFFACTWNLLMISKNWSKEKIIGTLWHPRHSPSQISYGRLQEKIWSFAQRTENSLPLQRVSRLQKAFEWVHRLFWLVPITKPIFLWIYQQFWLVPITKGQIVSVLLREPMEIFRNSALANSLYRPFPLEWKLQARTKFVKLATVRQPSSGVKMRRSIVMQLVSIVQQ